MNTHIIDLESNLQLSAGDTIPGFARDGALHLQTYSLVDASIRPKPRLLSYSSHRGCWKVISNDVSLTYRF